MKQMKSSKQRNALLALLRSVTCHPTADWLYNELKKEFPSLSLGTVYRNLALLVQMGDIQELCYGSDTHRFDGNAAPHYHFSCTECGSVIDIPMPRIEGLEEQAEEVAGVKPFGHRLEFYGICKECQKCTKAEQPAS